MFIFFNTFKNEINGVIRNVFPLLNNTDVELLTESLYYLMNVISAKFNFDSNKTEDYFHQFRQNNYRDVRALLFILLPYIDENKDNTNKKALKNLADLYLTMKKDVKINDEEPKYKYSSIQYERCERNKKIEPMKFEYSSLKQNMTLFIKTLDICSNKLYVNWIDILPFTIKNYKEKYVYKETLAYFRKNGLPYGDKLIEEFTDTKTNIQYSDYQGLYVGDIYNTINNYLYQHVKNYKWLIYEYELTNSNFVPYFIIFANLLPLDGTVNKKNWANLEDGVRDDFIIKWNRLLSSLNASTTPSSNLPSQTIQIFLYSFIISFDKYYDDIEKAKREDGYIKMLNVDSLDDEATDIDKSLFEPNIKSVKPIHVYTYIKQSIESIKNTWYFDKLVTFNTNLKQYEIIDVNVYRMSNLVKNETSVKSNLLSLKNIYNYSKSITNYVNEKDEFTPYPKFWRSCDDEQKKTFLARLQTQINKNTLNKSGKDLMKWFNISRVLIKMYGEKIDFDGTNSRTENILPELHASLVIDIGKIIIDIVFEILIMNGVLTEFVPNKTISDYNKLPTDKKQREQKQLEYMGKYVLSDDKIKNYWNTAYHFLTCEPFSQLDKIYIKDKYGKQQSEHYLKLLTNDFGSWATSYPLDWMSQISFFHRYIHSRVLYVTGSTGVGKSTQVPKLLLYATKMIDYKGDGGVICTIPRTPPTLGVSKRVANEMGVPIKQYCESINNEILTTNYYIQYQTKNDKHKNKVNHPYLRFVTDGTLYADMKTNPILKTMEFKGDKGTYTEKNMYDIVIIDEAHEHNANMDIILTLMRYATYYNNDIKLVIMSATMDDDEPVYRRYYRDINNNRMYPFDIMLETYNLDRINVDKRLHISPPGETTKFKIDEFYRPGEEGEDIVVDIIKNTTSGDILLFKPGKAEINKAIKYLNTKLPADVYVIPYYSAGNDGGAGGGMSDSKRDFVEKLSEKTKRDFVYPKNVNYAKISEHDLKFMKQVPKGTYKRFVIVGTNIAEASLTINSLKYTKSRRI